MSGIEPMEKTVAPELSALAQLRGSGRFRGKAALFGPAFVAAVAYIDPGNFATNFSAGAKFGYLLVWVIVLANVIAMLVQYLSSKVGVVTGKDLPELCRAHFSRRVSIGLWIQAELIAMATDLAEFVGAAVGLNLLFNVPLLSAGLITAVIAFAILALQTRGYRRFELAIAWLLGVVFTGFLYETLKIGPDASGVVRGLLVPGFQGSESVLLAVGIIGATVMPHVIYLHSELTAHRVAPRDDAERHQLLRFQRLDVVAAMSLAGIVNLAMLAVSARLFYGSPLQVDTIEAAHAGFAALVGPGAALAFAVALLASGASASSVGTYAGQIVMAGFVNLTLPLFIRRLITMVPAITLLAVG